ncbi:MAG: hypothetical protein JSU86_04710 [Phycisphaerales bacterium]|nr:MAG: hypothetical protein JSU86_04710 [Phycisphaerales bacterium]
METTTMGFWDLLKNINNAEGIRESMRMSYDKHYNQAQSGQGSAPDTTPAQYALYGALASRYQVDGLNPPEMTVWAELAPFLALSRAEGREYLAEYIVYREKPADAKVNVLRKKVSEGLRAAEGEVKVMAAMAVEQGVAWGQLVDKHTRTTLKDSLLEGS